jgi:hypothetical protein
LTILTPAGNESFGENRGQFTEERKPKRGRIFTEGNEGNEDGKETSRNRKTKLRGTFYRR